MLKPTLNERARRLWAGSEAHAIGWGGVAAVARATGLAISTVRKGRDEARAGAVPAAIGKAIPYGIYDIGANDGFVSVGTDHDTPVFAVTSIEAWWKNVGSKRYADAREVFITADAGGSNAYRSRVWKYELQQLADKLGIAIHVSHLPPGTSKWNKVEHRLFSFISINWRGRPLRTYETVVNLIANTTNRGGLVVRAQLDRGNYPIGRRVSNKDFRTINIEKDDFHGDWNYVIRPRGVNG